MNQIFNSGHFKVIYYLHTVYWTELFYSDASIKAFCKCVLFSGKFMERNLTNILEYRCLMTFKSYLDKNLQNPNGETDGFKNFLTED